MDKFFVILTLCIFILSLFLFMFDYSKSLISGIGGIIASVFWFLHIRTMHKDIMGAKYEILSAFSWFIFSLFVIIASYYD